MRAGRPIGDLWMARFGRTEPVGEHAQLTLSTDKADLRAHRATREASWTRWSSL